MLTNNGFYYLYIIIYIFRTSVITSLTPSIKYKISCSYYIITPPPLQYDYSPPKQARPNSISRNYSLWRLDMPLCGFSARWPLWRRMGLKLTHWLGLEGCGHVLVSAPGRRRKRMMKQKRSRRWREGLLVGFRVGRHRCHCHWRRGGGCFQLVCVDYGIARRAEGKKKVNRRLLGVDLLPHRPYSCSHLHSRSHSHSCSWDVNRPDPLLLMATKTGGDQGELSQMVN